MKTLLQLTAVIGIGVIVSSCDHLSQAERRGAEAHAENLCLMKRGGATDEDLDDMHARADLLVKATKASPEPLPGLTHRFIQEGERIAQQRGCR